MLKERPPSGEGERRSYSCQCVSTGRMTRGHQDSTRSCESCRTRSERRECAFPEPSFVPHRALMPYYRERKGSSRQAASSVGVQNKHSVFPKALQSSTTLRGKQTTLETQTVPNVHWLHCRTRLLAMYLSLMMTCVYVRLTIPAGFSMLIEVL